MDVFESKKQFLKTQIARLEWDIPNIVNKEVKSKKEAQLDLFKRELSEILNINMGG